MSSQPGKILNGGYLPNMDVLILDKRKNIQVTSVIIASDPLDKVGEKLHMFFCYNCQNPIAQYIGRVIRITPGSTPLSLPVLLKCRCGKVYQIEDIL
jgi:hypothetical protein